MSNTSDSHGLIQWHGTTIIGVRRGGVTVMGDHVTAMTLNLESRLAQRAGTRPLVPIFLW